MLYYFPLWIALITTIWILYMFIINLIRKVQKKSTIKYNKSHRIRLNWNIYSLIITSDKNPLTILFVIMKLLWTVIDLLAVGNLWAINEESCTISALVSNGELQTHNHIHDNCRTDSAIVDKRGKREKFSIHEIVTERQR